MVYQNAFRKHLMIAIGSCNEAMVLLDMTRDLGYLDKETHQNYTEQYDKLGRKIYKLIQAWK